MSFLLTGCRLKVWGTDGNPLNGGLVYTYAAGTTTPKTCYSDAAKTTPKANPFTLDAYGEADVWLDGNYKITIKTSAGVTLPVYPIDNIPGNVVSTSDLASSTGATMVGYGSTTVAAALDSVIANNRKVTTRQTAISGPHTSTGDPNLGGATGSAVVTTTGISAGANRFLVTAGGGFNDSGALDYIGYSDTNIAWSGLTTNGVMYLYVDINTTSGALTTGSTTLAPVYSYGTPAVTNGQFTYQITEGIAYLGNGATAAACSRVFVGEVDVAANVVSAIRWYAYGGRYDSGFTNTLPTTATTITRNHNIGTSDTINTLVLECLTAEAGFSVGDRLYNPSSFDGTVVRPTQIYGTRNTAQFSTASTTAWTVYNKTTGANATLTLANWKYKMLARRDWN